MYLTSCRHVLVAVGADRVMRFWDCFSGACLAETFTGHQQGESVAALALAPDNKTAVTADTAGYIMVSSSWVVLHSCIASFVGMHMGYRYGESVAALALATDNTTAVTADTSGNISWSAAVWLTWDP